MARKSQTPKISECIRGRKLPHIGFLSREELDEVIRLGEWFRDHPADRSCSELLRGRLQVLLFVYESTRTRLGFEAAMAQLGGSTTYLAVKDTQMGRGESVKDTARALDQYMDVFAGRLWSQDDIETISAKIAMVPSTTVPVAGAKAHQVINLVEALEEHEDVQNVFANFDIPQEIIAEASK